MLEHGSQSIYNKLATRYINTALGPTAYRRLNAARFKPMNETATALRAGAAPPRVERDRCKDASVDKYKTC